MVLLFLQFVFVVVLSFRLILFGQLLVRLVVFFLVLVVVGALDALDVDCLFKAVHLFDVDGLERLVLNCNASFIRLLVPIHPQNH